ncbi:MAG: type II CAAX endopeptidase family protein [Crocinitomicaceae bacterium]|nr:type II CAAX endopeptidase family protein [Crocinitomicaceae bacterium]
MHLVKPIIYTLLYIVFIELIAAWLFIADYFEADFLYDFYLLINGLIMASALIVFTFLAKNRKSKLPQSTSINWYVLSAVVGLLYVFVQTPLNWVYNLLSNEQYNIIYEFKGFGIFTDINILSTIVLIPIAEELFFREFIQKNLQKHTRAIVAIVLTSILFASIHLPYENLILGYPTFSFHHAYMALFGGLILGVVYFKSKSIGPSIVMHMLWNLMVVIV